jgi:hypothetical protein
MHEYPPRCDNESMVTLLRTNRAPASTLAPSSAHSGSRAPEEPGDGSAGMDTRLDPAHESARLSGRASEPLPAASSITFRMDPVTGRPRPLEERSPGPDAGLVTGPLHGAADSQSRRRELSRAAASARWRSEHGQGAVSALRGCRTQFPGTDHACPVRVRGEGHRRRRHGRPRRRSEPTHHQRPPVKRRDRGPDPPAGHPRPRSRAEPPSGSPGDLSRRACPSRRGSTSPSSSQLSKITVSVDLTTTEGSIRARPITNSDNTPGIVHASAGGEASRASAPRTACCQQRPTQRHRPVRLLPLPGRYDSLATYSLTRRL